MQMKNKVVILGDSSHNTLSAVRSFGEAKIPLTLILVGVRDTCFVGASKYLKKGNLHCVRELDECMSILMNLSGGDVPQTLMTTFDAAAEWVDAREPELSRLFLTPCRGKRLGPLFNKAEQCKLAKECGLTVPFSVIYERGNPLPENEIGYPLITKPLVSSLGEKSDIHICRSKQDLLQALEANSHCDRFIMQEFIEKEYEIDAVGVSLPDGVVMGGAIQKIRHWPRLVGAGAFGVFRKISDFDVDQDGIRDFLKRSGYLGPFSVELLHTSSGSNYFMEVNFRNEGLAYASTCAGANLHALYLDSNYVIDWTKFRTTYMMNYSIDFLYVKQGDITLWHWLKDFLKTRCFINMCFSDLGPVLAHYKRKLLSRRKVEK